MSVTRFNIEPFLNTLQQQRTVLTPNNRSVNAILQEYGNYQRGSRAWLRPPVFAIDIWLQQLWTAAAANGIEPFDQLRLLDRFSEQCIWTKQLDASSEQYPLLNTGLTANPVARSYHLSSQWLLFEDAALAEQQHAQDFSAFLTWCAQYRAYCKANQLIGLSDAIALLLDRLDDLEPLLPESLLLVSFTEPPPLYERLFDALATRIDVQRFSRAESKTEAGDLLFSQTSTSPGKFGRYQFPDLETEARACVDHCLEQARLDDGKHIGIIIDQGKNHEFVLRKAFDRRLKMSHCDFSPDSNPQFNLLQGSQLLADAKRVELAVKLIELNHRQVDTEKFCHLMQSAQLAGTAEELQQRIKLQLVLRRKLASTTRLSSLRTIMNRDSSNYHCPGLADQLLQFTELARRCPSHQMLQAWINLFKQQLTVFGWPGTTSSTVELRDGVQWEQALDQLAATSAIHGKVDFGSALRILKLLLKQIPRRQPFDSNLNISLMSLEEAQDFDFDTVWLLATDNNSLPSPVNPALFLPRSIQQRLAMPGSSSETQLQMCKAQLTRLSRQTAHLIISHHEYEDDLQLSCSPLIDKLTTTPWPGHSDSAASLQGERAVTLEQLQEPLWLPLEADIDAGGTGLLSNQSNCPFRAFARYRLGAEQLPAIQQGLNPMVRGSALHLALDRLSEELDTLEKIQQCPADERRQIIATSIEPAISQLRDQLPDIMTPAFAALERQRLSTLLEGFLDYETDRPEFTVSATEQSLSWSHSRLALKFRIDRIDQLGDGSLALIDYKSGKKFNYRWFDDRPDDLQLPLYQLALSAASDNVIATLIYQVNIDGVSLFGPTDNELIHPGLKLLAKTRSFNGSWSELQERWEHIVFALAEEFEQGLLAVAPTRGSQTCQYCELPALCRINERLSMRDRRDEELT